MIRPERLTDSVTLYEGDCLEVLPMLTGVDAVVTDPPYGIGFKYSEHDDTPEGYGKWLWSVLELCESLCSPGSPVFVWQAMLNVRRFAEWFPRDFRLFAAAKNFVQIRDVAMQNAYDPAVVWWVQGERWFSSHGNRDWHVADTASVMCRKGNIEKAHPCPRPLDQMRHVVSHWCKPDSTILDPFGGSGTTAIAAMKEGRRCILIEKDAKYCEIIRRRVREADGAGVSSLFREVAQRENLFAEAV